MCGHIWVCVRMRVVIGGCVGKGMEWCMGLNIYGCMGVLILAGV